MSLKERVYSILVVSSAENFNTVLSTLLPESKFAPVTVVSSVSAAKRLLVDRDFDLVIINAPLPDDMGIHFAIDTCASRQSIVLILVKSDIQAGIFDKVVPYGVFTLPKPTSKATLTQAFQWMISARERLRRSEKKTSSIEEKMKEIRTVNHAKWILISELKMNEEEAHKYIEKQAMDNCISRKDIAEQIIKNYS